MCLWSGRELLPCQMEISQHGMNHGVVGRGAIIINKFRRGSCDIKRCKVWFYKCVLLACAYDVCNCRCSMMAPKSKKRRFDQVEATSPKLHGGYKQRLAASSNDVQPSKLVQWLLQQYWWGNIAATSMQQVAEAAHQDGLKHPDLLRTQGTKYVEHKRDTRNT